MQYLSLFGITLHGTEYSQWPQLSQTCYLWHWQGGGGGDESETICLYLCPTLESSSSLSRRPNVCTVGLFSRKQSFLVSLDKSCWKLVSVIEHFQHCHVRWNLNVILCWPLTHSQARRGQISPIRSGPSFVNNLFSPISRDQPSSLGTRKYFNLLAHWDLTGPATLCFVSDMRRAQYPASVICYARDLKHPSGCFFVVRT